MKKNQYSARAKPENWRLSEESEAFFFEKKKQKAFIRLSRAYSGKCRANSSFRCRAIPESAATALMKAFCFFFSKKKALPGSCCRGSRGKGFGPFLKRSL